uniref:CYRIA/CYRIB Rac1 binding domain-containing protein n=1 Tax=Arcella intermedia TaxID=1963864 RepID=A0A6B2LB28_9EUKA|eukprot:TRINITY_DN27679_c0_g1_i1.p1 TRINITY_DN27679_c0_g1~~TRINITY_DN27679_c0_g1_i1.p1  ORF type:complete len:316 (-),score=39.68 TRINITY_DN27679_c0_g1_i1:96-1043(-)
MGALATVLEGGNSKFKPSFVVDFENAQPSEGEKDLYNESNAVISRHTDIIASMSTYKGCAEQIKAAIQAPTDENKLHCWQALVPNVIILNDFHNHSRRIAEIFPKLLSALCSGNENSFNAQQALVKQLAHLIDFAMTFDDMKMNLPAISNDFSYFRRTSATFKNSASPTPSPITDEIANSLSLFYANPTPMLSLLRDSVKNLINSPHPDVPENVFRQNLTYGLSLMANICFHIVEIRQINETGLLLFCLRAAVGSTILVDGLYDPGIFHPKGAKKSPISPKYVLEVVKNFHDAPNITLINALRYNTKSADPKYFE